MIELCECGFTLKLGVRPGPVAFLEFNVLIILFISPTIAFEKSKVNALTTNVPHHTETSQLI